MNWIQLRLTLKKSIVADFETLLFANQALSITAKDAADQPILEPGLAETPLWDNVLVVALYEGTTNSREVQSFLESDPLWQHVQQSSWETLEDKDWVRAWMDDYHPMQFGKNLWICPSWQKTPAPDAVTIFLDPGLAFGTGTHPTTALCLTWLDANITKGEFIVDYGCGSGILSIAALKLGAARVQAIDYDTQALVATKENAKRNQIDNNQLDIVLPKDAISVKADGVIANILAETLRELAELITSQVKVGGWIVLSGILIHQSQDLITLYRQWFYMNEPVIMDEWVLLSGIRK